MPSLADIYSFLDSQKRRLSDTMANPGASLQQMLGMANDQARNFNQAQQAAANEWQQTRQLNGPATQNVDQMMAQSMAPTGMTASYKGAHIAPNAKVYGATLDNLEGIMPIDVYSSKGKNLYGHGDPQIDNEWWKAAYLAKDNPTRPTRIYRAVPKGVTDINSGDWVTTSKTYAQNHGESALNGDYDIISKTVKANQLSSEGYPYEFGYNED